WQMRSTVLRRKITTQTTIASSRSATATTVAARRTLATRGRVEPGMSDRLPPGSPATTSQQRAGLTQPPPESEGPDGGPVRRTRRCTRRGARHLVTTPRYGTSLRTGRNARCRTGSLRRLAFVGAKGPGPAASRNAGRRFHARGDHLHPLALVGPAAA